MNTSNASSLALKIATVVVGEVSTVSFHGSLACVVTTDDVAARVLLESGSFTAGSTSVLFERSLSMRCVQPCSCLTTD